MIEAQGQLYKIVGKKQNSKYILSGNRIFDSQKLNVYRDRNTSRVFEFDMSKISKQETQSIWQEIEIWKNVKHENVLKLINQFTQNQRYYVVIEYYPTNLTKYIQENKKCGQEKAMKLFHQMLSVFKNIIQKGGKPKIRPKQFTLTKQNKIKLSNLRGYNFLTILNRQNQMNNSQFLYKSPQQLMNQQYDQKSSVWSLGIIFYQLVFGKLPWNGRNQQQLLQSIRTICLDVGQVKEEQKQIQKQRQRQKKKRQKQKIRLLLENMLKIQRNARLNAEQLQKLLLKQDQIKDQIDKILQPKDNNNLLQNANIKLSQSRTSFSHQKSSQIKQNSLNKSIIASQNEGSQHIKVAINRLPLPQQNVCSIKSIEGILNKKKHVISPNQYFSSFQQMKQFSISPNNQEEKNIKNLQEMCQSIISVVDQQIINDINSQNFQVVQILQNFNNFGNVHNSNNFQYFKQFQHILDFPNIKNVQDVSNIQYVQNVQNVQNVQIVKNIENIENVEQCKYTSNIFKQRIQTKQSFSFETFKRPSKRWERVLNISPQEMQKSLQKSRSARKQNSIVRASTKWIKLLNQRIV